MTKSANELARISPAISKALLSIWLADHHLAAAVATASIDILKELVPDILKRKKINRIFEEIGDKVVECLEPILEIEFAGLDEGTKAAAVQLLEDRLNSGAISASSLVKNNINPTAISALLNVGVSKEISSLGDKGSALYLLLTNELARQLCSIASVFPAFSENAFGEVLTRTAQIQLSIDDVLSQLARIRANAPTGGVARVADYEANYLLAVSIRYDRVELFGIDVDESLMHYPLSTAYVSLSLQRNLEGISTSHTGPVNGAEDEQDRISISVEDLFSGASLLLIRGLAGQGKTTLLQWIAVQIAQRACPPPLDEWNKIVPFVVKLRQFRSVLPKIEDFAHATVPQVANPPNGWIENLFREGRALLLVDGIDEIARAHRNRVRDWLDGMREIYPLAKIVVTSRPSAVKEGWLNSAGFQEAEIQPMDRADTLACIEHWHRAIAHQTTEQAKLEDLARAEQRVREEIHSNRQLRELVTNPLLCAMVCALNLRRHHHIPRDRVELYEAACAMFLERRDKERGIPFDEAPNLTYAQKLLILQDVAYWMLRNNISEIEVEEFEKRIEESFELERSESRVFSSGDIRTFLVERVGILRMPTQDRVDFAHRTFLEFLAAKQVVAENDIGLAINCASKDEWREVIVLMPGIIQSNKVREKLVAGLLDKGDQTPSQKHRLHLLAVACLETSPSLPKATKGRIAKCLEMLVPPKNMTEARDLASAGEIALEHLKWNDRLKAIEAAASVRALRHIGSYDALIVLREYATDIRQTVRAELVRAWDFFESAVYAKEILSRLPPADRRLALTRKGSLAGLARLEWLRDVEIVSPAIRISLDELGSMQALERLSLEHVVRPVGIDALSRLSALQRLLVRGGQYVDEMPIQELTELRELSIQYADLRLDEQALIRLKKLQRLELSGLNLIKRLPELPSESALGELFVSGCLHLSSIDSLSSVKELREIRVIRCPSLFDFGVLRGCAKLTGLTIRPGDAPLLQNSAYDLRLNAMAPIEKVVVDAIVMPFLGDLANLKRVKQLTIHRLKNGDDLSVLERSKWQEDLNLFGAQGLKSLGGLPNIVKLRIASPARGQVESFETLTTLRKVRSLTLSGAWLQLEFGVLEQMDWVEEFDLSAYVGPLLVQLIGRLKRAKVVRISPMHAKLLHRGGVSSLQKFVVVQR